MTTLRRTRLSTETHGTRGSGTRADEAAVRRAGVAGVDVQAAVFTTTTAEAFVGETMRTCIEAAGPSRAIAEEATRTCAAVSVAEVRGGVVVAATTRPSNVASLVRRKAVVSATTAPFFTERCCSLASLAGWSCTGYRSSSSYHLPFDCSRQGVHILFGVCRCAGESF